MLESLFVSRVRGKLLKVFLTQPEEMFYIRQLVRLTDEEINSVRRELGRMEKYGMVKKEPRGNRLYYWLDKDFIFYQDLLSMIAKTTALGKTIIKNRNKLGNVKFVVFSGRFVRHQERKKENEIEVLVVGKVDLDKLAKLIGKEEKERRKEINYTLMEKKEFQYRKKRRDPFILEILRNSRVMIIGDEEKMIEM